MQTHDALTDLLPLSEACKLIPSRKPGRTLNVATMWRWILAGKVSAVRIGRHYFVSVETVRGLAKPVVVARKAEPVKRERSASDARTAAVLRDAGFKGY